MEQNSRQDVYRGLADAMRHGHCVPAGCTPGSSNGSLPVVANPIVHWPSSLFQLEQMVLERRGATPRAQHGTLQPFSFSGARWNFPCISHDVCSAEIARNHGGTLKMNTDLTRVF